MKFITLVDGVKVKVDDEDYEYLSRWKWWHGSRNYAYRQEESDGKTITFIMHRVINKTPKGMDTDHINRDTLDNRKSNLRSVTKSQNAMNRPKQVNNTSGYKGVSYHRKNRNYRAYISINKQWKHLGSYKTAEEAHKAYLMAAKYLHKEYACN